MRRSSRKECLSSLCETGTAKAPRGQQADDYQRLRDLPKLLPLWPDEISDETVEGARKLIAKLKRALRAERRRGRAGHWSYDLDRHLRLVRAHKSEMTRLENMMDI
jgi:hypothetical protein